VCRDGCDHVGKTLIAGAVEVDSEGRQVIGIQIIAASLSSTLAIYAA